MRKLTDSKKLEKIAEWIDDYNTENAYFLESIASKLHKIKTWCEAYPLDIFPEPDFKKAHEVLKKNGLSLDAISASNMRHVLNGIKKILEDK